MIAKCTESYSSNLTAGKWYKVIPPARKGGSLMVIGDTGLKYYLNGWRYGDEIFSIYANGITARFDEISVEDEL